MKFSSTQLADRIFATIAVFMAVIASAAQAQAGFPDHLRQYSDTNAVPFRIGTAITLQGGPSLYPPNGYQPGLLTSDPRDKAYQAVVRSQFNQIEAGNETKMMSLWTGGAARVNGHYVALTNLYDANGPLSQLCTWAGTQQPRLTVRGHCMVYNQNYTLPTFPAGQQPLFVPGAGGETGAQYFLHAGRFARHASLLRAAGCGCDNGAERGGACSVRPEGCDGVGCHQ